MHNVHDEDFEKTTVLIDRLPSISNGLMENDNDVIRSLEAVCYPSAADRIRTIRKIRPEKYEEFVEYIATVLEKEMENPDFAHFADTLEDLDAEIVKEFDIWPTISYVTIRHASYGTLDLSDNIEIIIDIVNQFAGEGLGRILWWIERSKKLAAFIDILQKVGVKRHYIETYRDIWSFDTFHRFLLDNKKMLQNFSEVEKH